MKNINEILSTVSMWEVIDETPTTVKIEIQWGDWKHDHLRADYLMKESGWELVDRYTTEDDGSDCYSAVHAYKKAE